MFDENFCRPELLSWPDLIKHSFNSSNNQEKLRSIKLDIREQVLNLAQEYTSNLSLNKKPIDKNLPIIAFGHQPVVYHAGLIAKQQKLLEFSEIMAVNALEVVIDTDEGGAAEIVYPNYSELGWQIMRLPVSEGQGPYMFHKIAKIADKSAVLPKGHTTHLLEFIDGINEFQDEDRSSILSKLRHEFLRDNKTYIVPLSKIMQLPAVIELLKFLLLTPIKLVESYNSTLNQFRLEHKIKNAANPFPNMQIDEYQAELPFWILDLEQSRRVPLAYNKQTNLFVVGEEHIGLESLLSKYLVAPRGMLTTLFFRSFLVDLFIHGLGGEKYDPAVEQFIVNFLGLEPAKFVTVSANKYLLRDEYKKFVELDAIFSRQRELYNRPANALEYIVDHKLKLDLNTLIKSSTVIRENMLQLKAQGQSTAGIQSELSATNLEIRNLLDQAIFMPQKASWQRLESSRAAFTCREYSYFLLG